MKHLSILLALLALVLASCRAEVRIVLDVAEDGSGTIAAEVGLNDQLRDLITQLFGSESEEVIAGLDLGLEGTSQTRTEGNMTIYTTDVAFSDPESIQEAAAGNFTAFRLELADEGVSLEATLDLAGELDLSEFPLDPNAIDDETLQEQIIVSLPGEPDEHNADQILADGRYVWDIPLDSELYMFANTLYPTGGFPWWLPGLLGLSGSLALAVWFAAVRRDKQGGPVRRPAPEPPPPTADRAPTQGATTESPFFEIEDE
jgi:hypothetical protein